MPAHPNVQPEKGFLFPGRTQQFKSYPNAVYNITLNVNIESNVFLLEDECLKAEILCYAEGYGQCYVFCQCRKCSLITKTRSQLTCTNLPALSVKN